MNFDILSNRLAGMADEVRIAIEALAELEQKDKSLNEFKKKVVVERELLHKKEAELLKKQSTVEVMIGGIEEKRKIAEDREKKAQEAVEKLKAQEKVVDEKLEKSINLEGKLKDLEVKQKKVDEQAKELEELAKLLKREKIVDRERKELLDIREKKLDRDREKIQRYLN